MRKTIFLSAILSSIVIACTNEPIVENQISQISDDNHVIRSYEEAKGIACSAIKMLENNSSTRSKGGRRVSENSTHVILASEVTRGENDDLLSDTLLYVFNYENNEGFAVVSANRNTEGLLAVTEAGSYDPSEQQEIGGFDMFMQLAEGYVRSTPQGLINPDGPKEHMIVNDTIVSGISPRVDIMWGQNWPEGRYCPNHKAGCASTAAAMILSYFEYPTSMTFSFPERDIDSQNINWAELKNHQQSISGDYLLDSCITCTTNMEDSVHHTIGRICRELGKRSNSDYGASTSTRVDSIMYVLEALGYSIEIVDNVSSHFVVNDIGSGLLYMEGKNENGKGHAWIADGYRRLNITSNEYERPQNFEGWILIYTTNWTHIYNHINWGFGGKNNGYFYDRVFNLAQCRWPDQNNVPNNKTNNYQNNVKYFIINR